MKRYIRTTSHPKLQKFADSLKSLSDDELTKMRYSLSYMYTQNQLNLIDEEYMSRRRNYDSPLNRAPKWDDDIQEWYDVEVSKLYENGYSRDAIPGQKAALFDQANRKQQRRQR